MAPLDEATALALVRDCSANCESICFAPHLCTGEFVHRIMLLNSVVSEEGAEAVRSQALAWRRTMETLNALACCRCLGVQENPRFWRQGLVALTLQPREQKESKFCALDDALFTIYRLRLDVTGDKE